jgi:hypothetical protein
MTGSDGSQASSSKRGKVVRFFARALMGVQTQCSKAAGLLRREKPVVSTTGVSSDDIAFVIPPLNLPSVSLSVGRSTSDAKNALSLPKSPSLVCNAATASLDDNASLGIDTDVDNASLAVDKIATRRSSQMVAEPANETFPSMTAAVPGKSRKSYRPSSTATGRSAEDSRLCPYGNDLDP